MMGKPIIRCSFCGWQRTVEYPKVQQTVVTAIEYEGSKPTIGVVLRGIDPKSVKPGDILVKR